MSAGKKKAAVERCVWTEDTWYGEVFDTDCGEKWVFETDGPKQNGMKFCCYCGKPLKEKRER